MDELIQAKVTPQMKEFLERWADEQECTVASLLRRLIKSEMVRQASTPTISPLTPAVQEFPLDRAA